MRASPVRRFLIVLDCCFSGGMGAKALQVDGRGTRYSVCRRQVEPDKWPWSRDFNCLWSDAESVGKPAASGMGSSASHLLEALQGPEEIREGNRIGVLRLLDYVVQACYRCGKANPARAASCGARDLRRRVYLADFITGIDLSQLRFLIVENRLRQSDISSLSQFWLPASGHRGLGW